jgi:hypothetical protein
MAPREPQRTGAWIFLSHSNKDWSDVREIRNLLEERGHRPLMFFLKCLAEESELDDLLRREIEARTWFLLCDSRNARASRYVQAEVAHIESLDWKYSERIDLEGPVEDRLERIDRLCRRATVYVSYQQEDRDVALRIRDFLAAADYDVYWPEEAMLGTADWEQETVNAISEAARRGFVLVLLSQRALKSKWVAREVELADSVAGGHASNIIALPLDCGAAVPDDTNPKLRFYLSTSQWIPLSTCSLEQGLRVLVQSMIRRRME